MGKKPNEKNANKRGWRGDVDGVAWGWDKRRLLQEGEMRAREGESV